MSISGEERKPTQDELALVPITIDSSEDSMTTDFYRVIVNKAFPTLPSGSGQNLNTPAAIEDMQSESIVDDPPSEEWMGNVQKVHFNTTNVFFKPHIRELTIFQPKQRQIVLPDSIQAPRQNLIPHIKEVTALAVFECLILVGMYSGEAFSYEINTLKLHHTYLVDALVAVDTS